MDALRPVCVLMAVSVLTACAATALGQPDLSYEETFDSAVDWQTNNAARYYLDAGAPGYPSPAYRAEMWDNSDEYATVALPHDGHSFTITFDVLIESMNWSGDFNFGWFDASREAFYYSPGLQRFLLTFGMGDLGKGIGLYAWDEAGVSHQGGHEYPTDSWTTNVWYNAAITYDELAGTLSATLHDAATGALQYQGVISGIAGFSTLEHLGMSKVSDRLTPSAHGMGWIDNVRVMRDGGAGCPGDYDRNGEINSPYRRGSQRLGRAGVRQRPQKRVDV